MAKKETVRKEFAWDTQERIGGYGDAKERHEVFICTLNGKRYIQDTKEVMTTKNGWKRVRGATMPLNHLKELYHLLSAWELENAFPHAKGPQIAEKASNLKATHQAKGSSPIRGRKVSVADKVKANENFGSLKGDLQAEALKLAEELHEDEGMLSIGITKTKYFIVSGKPQIEAEKHIKAQKGFSRALITFIP